MQDPRSTDSESVPKLSQIRMHKGYIARNILNAQIVCLLFYVLATRNVILGWTLICDSAHSGQLHSAAPPGDQSVSTMI